MTIRPPAIAWLLTLLGFAAASAQVKAPTKISFSQGIFIDRLEDLDSFGGAVASIGDLDGDGVNDLVVGAPLDDDGAASLTANRGAIWILFLRSDGTVRDQQKISSTEGGFRGRLDDNDQFGSSIVSIGDLDGDGVTDLAVGAPNDDGAGVEQGAVWILNLTRAGTVKSYQKLNSAGGVLGGALADWDHFGSAVAALGDVDGDGVTDIAVGAPGDDDQGRDRGAVWIVNLLRDGNAKAHRKLGSGSGKFAGSLDDADHFGRSLSALGDLDGDGITELAVGAPLDDDGGATLAANRGAVWILFLDRDGSVKFHQKLSHTEGKFHGKLDDNDHFGGSVAAAGDIDGDGVTDLAIGAPLDDDGGTTQVVNRGAAWIIFLRPDGTAKSHQKLSDVEGDFTGVLDDNDQFGASVAALGDLDGDGVNDLAVGAPGDDDGGATLSVDRGAVWIIFLRENGTARPETKLSNTEGNFTSTLDDFDRFGASVAFLGDLDGDGIGDLAVGAENDDDGGLDMGAVWILFLNPDGSVIRHAKVSAREGEFTGSLDIEDHFGGSVAALGDLDGDGVADLAVGAPFDDDGGRDVGAVWILFMNQDGTVRSHSKLSASAQPLAGVLQDAGQFGRSITGIGDLDGDGVADIAVGAPNYDAGGPDYGAVWILLLRPDGTVKAVQRISSDTGILSGRLSEGDMFGTSLAAIGDLDGNGVVDLAVGAPNDDELGTDRGAVWLLYMQDDGSVKSVKKITSLGTDASTDIQDSELFGISLAARGDLDGDGVDDLVVGSNGIFGGGDVRILLLRPDGSVKSHQKHGRNDGDFIGAPIFGSLFGGAVASMGDIDGDGVPELAVGAPGDKDGGFGRGAVWISFNALLPPPLIQDVRFTPDPPTPGAQLQLSAQLIVPNGIVTAELNFRSSGDAQFLNASMTEEGPGQFSLAIPSFVMGTRGIEYFITASNQHGHRSRHPASGVVSLPVFIPDGLATALVHGSSSEAYRLYSIPLDLDDKSARTMLESDLSSYNKKRWRFFGYIGSDEFVELDERDMVVEPGVPFWLLTKESGNSVTTGPGTSVWTEKAYAIPMQPGWNYIGNPFNFSIPLSNLTMKSSQPVDARTYEGFWSGVDESIEPWKGYAAFNANPTVDTLLIDPDISAIPTDSSNQVAGKREDTAAWSIRILAQRGLARDVDNVAAVSPGAAEGWDPLDRPEAPVVGDFVSVYFPHPEWNRNTATYSTDTRPPNSQGAAWVFEVATHSPGPVTLRFDNLDSVPPDFGVRLYDEALSDWRDLRVTDRYVVASSGGGAAKRLLLAAGTRAFLDGEAGPSRDVPERVQLFQNFPNPFSSVTTIHYGLPDNQSVSLTVFDALGRRVATLLERVAQDAGYHAIVWDGRADGGVPLASGVYVMQLRSRDYVANRTIAIVR